MLIFLNEAIRLFLIKEKKQLIYWNHSFLYCDREHMTSTQRGGVGFCRNVDANVIRIGKTRKICGQGGGEGVWKLAIFCGRHICMLPYVKARVLKYFVNRREMRTKRGVS